MTIPEPLSPAAERAAAALGLHADLSRFCVEDGADPLDSLEAADLVISYDGPDNDDDRIATDALASLTHVPDDLFDFTLTTSPQTGVPILLVTLVGVPNPR